MDRERMDKVIFNFVGICVEIELRKGLLDHIHPIFQESKWTQLLDFENVAFRC